MTANSKQTEQKMGLKEIRGHKSQDNMTATDNQLLSG